eukprot:TRINITY_DN7682_c0_g1_i1.p1 TRINITY_DN7682_c0_g1~~TRINITY_DN7682_c0_g1_i1.p1  ORF type:complete len:328 (+),score=50.50 TRINITY_DN7682_c0_g1_i1:14-997(+)
MSGCQNKTNKQASNMMFVEVTGTVAATVAIILWVIRLTLLFKKGVLIRRNKSDAIGKLVKLSHGYTHYYLSGPKDGPLVIFIHGFSVPSQPYIECGMAEYYRKAGYTFLTYDLYGRGHSDAPDAKYTPELYIGQLIELLYELDIKSKFDLVGYSMGGAFSLYFTQAYPKLVNRLVLVSSAGVKLSVEGVMKLLKVPILGEAFFNIMSNSFLQKDADDENEGSGFAQALKSYSIKQQSEHEGLTRSLYSTIKNFDMSKLTDVLADVAKLEKKVLIVHGEDDYLVPYESAETLQKTFKNSKLKTVKGGTHTILLEQMEEVHNSITEFLG